MRVPDYDGGSIVNLIAELERRLTGTAPLPGLHADLATMVPAAETYVLVLFDGLGDHQLTHPRARTLSASRAAALDATFPSTTIVALSSLVTATAPAAHGVVSHFLNHEQHGIVNALKWAFPGGRPVPIDTAGLLPAPNLWERLRAAGIEPITVQPGNFEGSPTSQLLYRGCRFEGAWTERDLVEITLQLAEVPGRLILTYFPHVDLAAHVAGQASSQYADAIGHLDTAWSSLAERLPDHAVAVATADHGHIDYAPAQKLDLGKRSPATVFGDPRALFARGRIEKIRGWAEGLPGTLVEDPRPLFGSGDHPALADRLPNAILFASPDQLLIPSYMDDRLIGYHGGLEDRELRVPLLVSPGRAQAAAHR